MELTLCLHPTCAQVAPVLQSLATDPLRHFHSDHTLHCLPHLPLWLLESDREPAGIWYLQGAWIGTYFMPPYRGKVAVQSWQLVRPHCPEALFAAIRTVNLPACHFARTLGFTRVGVWPRFTRFQSVWGSVALYSLRIEDELSLWRAASVRAQEVPVCAA